MAELKITEAYAYDNPQDFEPKELNAKVIVHFRPKVNWKGIGYGFDWMRIGDYSEIETNPEYNHGDTHYKDIISKHYITKSRGILQKILRMTRSAGRVFSNEEKAEIERTTQPDLVKDGVEYMLESDSNVRGGTYFKDETSFKELEKEYLYRKILAKPIEGEEGTGYEHYYCSWLSLYPAKEAILSLIIEVLDDTEPYTLNFFDENENYTVTKLATVDRLPIGRHIIPNAIKIVSNQEHTEDCPILAELTVEGTDHTLISGVLMTWANNASKHKKAKIVMIDVKTKESSPLSSSQSNNCEIIGCKNEASDFLKQMFIEMDGSLTISLNLSDKRQFKRGGCYYTEGGVLLRNVDNRQDPKMFEYLNIECKKKFRDKYPNLRNSFDEYTKLYFMDQHVYEIETRGGAPVDSGHSEIPNHKCVVFNNDLDAGYIIAHEVGHTCKLEHPFANKKYYPNAKYTYEGIFTDNIMDYTELAYGSAVKKGQEQTTLRVFTYWYWQWKIAQKSIR